MFPQVAPFIAISGKFAKKSISKFSSSNLGSILSEHHSQMLLLLSPS
jgi:hypothetical protein